MPHKKKGGTYKSSPGHPRKPKKTARKKKA